MPNSNIVPFNADKLADVKKFLCQEEEMQYELMSSCPKVSVEEVRPASRFPQMLIANSQWEGKKIKIQFIEQCYRQNLEQLGFGSQQMLLEHLHNHNKLLKCKIALSIFLDDQKQENANLDLNAFSNFGEIFNTLLTKSQLKGLGGVVLIQSVIETKTKTNQPFDVTLLPLPDFNFEHEGSEAHYFGASAEQYDRKAYLEYWLNLILLEFAVAKASGASILLTDLSNLKGVDGQYKDIAAIYRVVTEHSEFNDMRVIHTLGQIANATIQHAVENVDEKTVNEVKQMLSSWKEEFSPNGLAKQLKARREELANNASISFNVNGNDSNISAFVLVSEKIKTFTEVINNIKTLDDLNNVLAAIYGDKNHSRGEYLKSPHVALKAIVDLEDRGLTDTFRFKWSEFGHGNRCSLTWSRLMRLLQDKVTEVSVVLAQEDFTLNRLSDLPDNLQTFMNIPTQWARNYTDTRAKKAHIGLFEHGLIQTDRCDSTKKDMIQHEQKIINDLEKQHNFKLPN